MSPFRRLLGYAVPYRRDFLLGLGCVVVTTAVALVSPLVLRDAIDRPCRGRHARQARQYDGLLLGIGIVGGVFRYLMRAAHRRIAGT
jgi:ABC-type multidrug transport system fused ATPase/permease subunit